MKNNNENQNFKVLPDIDLNPQFTVFEIFALPLYYDTISYLQYFC